MEPFIVVDDVSYAYPVRGSKSAGEGAHALRRLSLQIAEGEYVAVVGANGSGKSTLARHLNALLVPDTGTSSIAGLDTRNPRNHPEIRRQVGMVFQRPEDQVVATLVEHDVAFGLENRGVPPAEIRARVDRVLHDLELSEHRDRPPHMLSAGQLQRLALAGVLAVEPRCIVFDEVTAMLDPAGRRAVHTLLRGLHNRGFTLVLITHLMDEVLEADRVVVLDRGSVALEGSPEDVFRAPEPLRTVGLDLPPAARLARALARHVRDPQAASALADALTVDAVIEALDRVPHGRCAHGQVTPATAAGTTRQVEAGPVPLIEAEDLGHIYMAGTPFAHRALHDADLAIHLASPHGLIGATGSGKSTLLQHLNGLLRPQEGHVRVDGEELGNPDTDLRQVRRTVGLVFQLPETQIFEPYVGDEIAYGPRLAGLVGEALRERVARAMALVGLDFAAFKDRYTFALSGGEKRKVALAAMLALEPRALLLDEPTAGLDPASRREIMAHFRELRASGMALSISSHQMDDVAELADELTVMVKGTTVASGPTARIFRQHDELLAWDLEQPTGAQVAGVLREHGWPLPTDLVTEAEIVEHMAKCLDSET